MERLGTIVVIALIAMLISGFFIWIGAIIVGVRRVTLGKSVMAAIGATFISGLMALIFSVIPVYGTALGLFLGLIFSVLVIKGAFNITFGKALLVWIFHIIAEVVAIIIIAIISSGTLNQLLPK